MKTRALIGCCLTLALLSLCGAQAEDQMVTLRFKHTPGQAHKFRFGMKSDMTMTPEGGAGGPGALPVGMKSTAIFTEKVKSVEGDSASLIVTPLSMILDNSVMGMSIAVKMEGGKLTMNGQEVGPDSPMAPLAGMLSNKPVEVRRGALGAVTPGPGVTSLNQMLNSSFLFQLPDHPVKIGDSWETSESGGSALGLGGGIGGGLGPKLPDMQLKLTHTLKALENKGGHVVAVIETKGGSGAAEGAADDQGQKYEGTVRFDVTAGGVQSAQYSADVKTKINLAGLLSGGAGGAGLPGAPDAPKPENLPGAMRIDGMMKLDLAELPLVTAPAKPAVKKPVAKKPVAKGKRR
jgi:hypothetical protein